MQSLRELPREGGQIPDRIRLCGEDDAYQARPKHQRAEDAFPQE